MYVCTCIHSPTRTGILGMRSPSTTGAYPGRQPTAVVHPLVPCSAAAVSESDSASVFVSEPQDARVRPGDTVQLDCELTVSSREDICAWRIADTHLGVDHFYNVAPPDKVRALFPDHERICSILVEDADWRHDGRWTCWPLADTSHVSSRTARLVVSGEPGGTVQQTGNI